jgi:hypothetical protein
MTEQQGKHGGSSQGGGGGGGGGQMKALTHAAPKTKRIKKILAQPA